jgi:hypothetical protein
MIRNLEQVRIVSGRTRVDEGRAKVISPGGDEERETGGEGALHRATHERGTERLLAVDVDEDLTDLLFQDPPPPQAYPDR